MKRNFDPELTRQIQETTGAPVTDIHPVTGGDIAEAFRLETKTGPLFMKVMTGFDAQNMLRSEAKGLEWLSECPEVRIPEVMSLIEVGNTSALIMEYIVPGRAKHGEKLGLMLAKMHMVESNSSGWKEDNFIGLLPQRNKTNESWPVFWRKQRLLPQLRKAEASKGLTKATISKLNVLVEDLESHLPPKAAHRLHGDLWNGNVIWDVQGNPVLIDPAVYAGHREVDLAMMQLFGGFSRTVYETYNHHYPLENEWQQRLPIYQLYYALVHVNLFGSSYEAMVVRLLDEL